MKKVRMEVTLEGNGITDTIEVLRRLCEMIEGKDTGRLATAIENANVDIVDVAVRTIIQG